MNKKFAERLKDLRIEKGLSQSELARRTGISSTAIVLWEAGQRSPTLDSAMVIAEFFGVSIDYLAGLEN